MRVRRSPKGRSCEAMEAVCRDLDLMTAFLAQTLFPFLLVTAGVSDFLTYRIPNWMTANRISARTGSTSANSVMVCPRSFRI